MSSIQNILKSRVLLWVAILFGVAARMWVATQGYNFDMDSWFVVADIGAHGGNVYAQTDRYNYGPVWFWILQGLDFLAGHRHNVLRFLIAGLLSLADVGICLLLRQSVGKLAGLFFILNPISIIITGFHGQFDNLAILMALGAVCLMGSNFDQPVNRRRLLGLLLLGLSLSTKHVMFVFPFWLAVRQKGWGQKALVFFVPVGCFLLSFVPYYSVGSTGIISHVFCFQPYAAGFFYHAFIPGGIQGLVDSQTLWLALMMLFAFICRTGSCLESFLTYLGVLTAFAPASYNEYLAIPVALVASYPNIFFLGYVTSGTVHLCIQQDGPHWFGASEHGCLRLVIELLCWGVLYHLWRSQFRQVLVWFAKEFQNQVGWPK